MIDTYGLAEFLKSRLGGRVFNFDDVAREVAEFENQPEREDSPWQLAFDRWDNLLK